MMRYAIYPVPEKRQIVLGLMRALFRETDISEQIVAGEKGFIIFTIDDESSTLLIKIGILLMEEGWLVHWINMGVEESILKDSRPHVLELLMPSPRKEGE